MDRPKAMYHLMIQLFPIGINSANDTYFCFKMSTSKLIEVNIQVSIWATRGTLN